MLDSPWIVLDLLDNVLTIAKLNQFQCGGAISRELGLQIWNWNIFFPRQIYYSSICPSSFFPPFKEAVSFLWMTN